MLSDHGHALLYISCDGTRHGKEGRGERKAGRVRERESQSRGKEVKSERGKTTASTQSQDTHEVSHVSLCTDARPRRRRGPGGQKRKQREREARKKERDTFCCAFVPFDSCGDGAMPAWGWSWGTPRVSRLLHEPMVSGVSPLGERCSRQREVSCLQGRRPALILLLPLSLSRAHGWMCNAAYQ